MVPEACQKSGREMVGRPAGLNQPAGQIKFPTAAASSSGRNDEMGGGFDTRRRWLEAGEAHSRTPPPECIVGYCPCCNNHGFGRRLQAAVEGGVQLRFQFISEKRLSNDVVLVNIRKRGRICIPGDEESRQTGPPGANTASRTGCAGPPRGEIARTSAAIDPPESRRRYRARQGKPRGRQRLASIQPGLPPRM
jgi:hypothetical protein